MRLFVGLLCAQVRGWLVGMVFDCLRRPLMVVFRWNTLIKIFMEDLSIQKNIFSIHSVKKDFKIVLRKRFSQWKNAFDGKTWYYKLIFAEIRVKVCVTEVLIAHRQFGDDTILDNILNCPCMERCFNGAPCRTTGPWSCRPTTQTVSPCRSMGHGG